MNISGNRNTPSMIAVVKVDRVTDGRYMQGGKTCKKAEACA
jgi:hypothetical protein